MSELSLPERLREDADALAACGEGRTAVLRVPKESWLAVAATMRQAAAALDGHPENVE